MKHHSMIILTLLALMLISIAPIAAQDTTECEDGFRAFTDGLDRTVCIPEEPERIVALHDAGVLLPMLELGVRPVGSASQVDLDGSTLFRGADPEGYDTEGIVPVGWEPVNLEAITELQPDLLIAQGDLESMPDVIEEIAPIIFINRFNEDHLDSLMMLADAIGMTDEALEQREMLEARIAEINAAIGDEDDITVTIMFWGGNGTFRPSLGYAMWDTVFDEISFGQPEAALAWDRFEDGSLSVEVLPDFSGDVIILEIFAEGADFPTLEEFSADPLASTLPAVQAEQVYTLSGIDVYGFSWAGSNRVLDLIEEILTDEDLDRDLVIEPDDMEMEATEEASD